MSSGDKHVSVPRIFSCGNFREWLIRFNICSKSNGWDDSKLHFKIATFLEGEALAVYLELSDADQQRFASITDALEKNFHPETEKLDIIAAFNSREMLPDETPRVFLHHLKNLLKDSGIDEAAHEKLLFFRFLAGLPSEISTQIKTSADIKTSAEALTAAQRLISVKSTRKTSDSAALGNGSDIKADELQDLKAAVNSLSAKVDELLRERQFDAAALRREQHSETTAVRGGPRPAIICFRCRRPGHPARLCRAPAATLAQRSGNRGGRGAAATPIFGRARQGSTNFS